MERLKCRVLRVASSGLAWRFTILALAGLVFAVGQAGPARAGSGVTVYLPLVFNGGSRSTSRAKPPTDPSFYITTTDPNVAYNLGCDQGLADASVSPPASSLVVLDFGGQLADGSGTLRINGGPITTPRSRRWPRRFRTATGTAPATTCPPR